MWRKLWPRGATFWPEDNRRAPTVPVFPSSNNFRLILGACKQQAINDALYSHGPNIKARPYSAWGLARRETYNIFPGVYLHLIQQQKRFPAVLRSSRTFVCSAANMIFPTGSPWQTEEKTYLEAQTKVFFSLFSLFFRVAETSGVNICSLVAHQLPLDEQQTVEELQKLSIQQKCD